MSVEFEVEADDVAAAREIAEEDLLCMSLSDFSDSYDDMALWQLED